MTDKGISRREFATALAALSALAATGARAGVGAKRAPPDLAVAKGPDAAANVKRAVAALGGMGAFVKPGQSVDLLLNFMCQMEAGRTKPAVIRSTVALLREAGATKLRFLDWGGLKTWKQTGLKALVDELGVEVHHVETGQADLWRKMPIAKSKALPEVRIFKALWEADVLITLPTFKHHGRCGFSGALKLFMATTHPVDNQERFHRDGGEDLEQCIADLNTVVRKPDLVIQEAMEILLANGPLGPGPVAKPEQIVVGTDRVALDTYCAPLHKLRPERCKQIQAAHAHGLGETNLKKLTVQEV